MYYYFQQFCRLNIWQHLHDQLYCLTRDLEGWEGSPSYAIVDSQSVRTGPDACEDTSFDAGKKIKGRKRHILVDMLGLLLKLKVHSASIQDRDEATLVFNKLTNRFPYIKKICADGGYQGKTVEKASPKPMEIIKRNQKSFQILPKRWIVERTFAWIKRNRRLTMDYEKYSKTSENIILIAF